MQLSRAIMLQFQQRAAPELQVTDYDNEINKNHPSAVDRRFTICASLVGFLVLFVGQCVVLAAVRWASELRARA